MGSYTQVTRGWLDNRFQKRTPEGHYWAHMPIYGVGHPAGEGNHVARLCRFLRILRVLDTVEFDTLLDVGGAEGYLAHVAATIFGVRTTTSDLSLEACLRARELFGIPGAAVDSSRLPFADDAFDVVVCSEVLEHVEAPVQTMLELARVANRAVVLTTEEVRYDRKAIDDYLFKRPGWPHMERNLFHPDDFTGCLPGSAMTPQCDGPPTQEDLTGDAVRQWILEHTRNDTMAPPAMGVVVTAPSASCRRHPRRHDDEQLLDLLLTTIIAPGHRAPPPDEQRQAAHFATMRDPLGGAALRADGDSLQGERRYPVLDGIPDFVGDTPQPTREQLCERVAALPAEVAAACTDLRDRLYLPDSWQQDHFDLRQREHQRGFWPNEQLVPRADATAGFCWRATDNDPWVVTPSLMRPVRAVELELRVHAPEHPVDALTGQIFFKGAEHETFSEPCSVKFPLRNDGQLHKVKVELGGNPQLPEEVQWLRLDLADAACEIDLLSITLQ